jgi:hypothetical protein
MTTGFHIINRIYTYPESLEAKLFTKKVENLVSNNIPLKTSNDTETLIVIPTSLLNDDMDDSNLDDSIQSTKRIKFIPPIVENGNQKELSNKLVDVLPTLFSLLKQDTERRAQSLPSLKIRDMNGISTILNKKGSENVSMTGPKVAEVIAVLQQGQTKQCIEEIQTESLLIEKDLNFIEKLRSVINKAAKALSVESMFGYDPRSTALPMSRNRVCERCGDKMDMRQSTADALLSCPSCQFKSNLPIAYQCLTDTLCKVSSC